MQTPQKQRPCDAMASLAVSPVASPEPSSASSSKVSRYNLRSSGADGDWLLRGLPIEGSLCVSTEGAGHEQPGHVLPPW